MRITVNGEAHEVSATTLADVLEELGYGGTIVATEAATIHDAVAA